MYVHLRFRYYCWPPAEMIQIQEDSDRLSAQSLLLQEEAIHLQRGGLQMQQEYEEVQRSIIRELCRYAPP